MRKHPLIALTAFTALGASAIAGTTTGTFSSVLTSANSADNHRSGSMAAHALALAASTRNDRISPGRKGLVVRGGRDLLAVHDPRHPRLGNLNSATGLPVVHHKRRHVVTVAAPAPPAPPPAPAPPAPAPTTTTAPPAPAAPAAPAGGVWYELRMCESGDNYSTNTGNGYYGAYQFSLSTWYGLGFSGLPSDAPPAVQDQAAAELQARSGWGQWPQCAAELGLY
jgi:hypothetical protein